MSAGAAPTYLAFDIGGTKVASGFVTLPANANAGADGRPEVTARCEIPTEAARGGEDLKNRIVAFAVRQLERAEAEGVAIAGVGIAAAGVPDSETGEIVSATDILPGWRGQRIYDAFAAVTDLPVHMIGDVGAHGLGEATYGAGRGRGVVLSIGVGTGIGGAIVVDGALFTGAHGVAGHAGHVPSALGRGFLCSCGTLEGHIEPVASGTGLKDLYNRRCEEAGDENLPAADGAEVAARAAGGGAGPPHAHRQRPCARRMRRRHGQPHRPGRDRGLRLGRQGRSDLVGRPARRVRRFGARARQADAARRGRARRGGAADRRGGGCPPAHRRAGRRAIDKIRQQEGTSMHQAIEKIRGGLVVSCQAYPGEPLRHPETMAQMAMAAVEGGAVGIRCQGLADIAAIKGQVSVPVIGIWKDGEEGVYITPTLRHARCCAAAGADIIAIDATGRPRPDGLTYAETVRALHDEGVIVMADCGSFADAERAVEAGTDIISTTLSGYTGERPKTDGPDFELLGQMIEAFPDVPVLCEGRIHTPDQLHQVMAAGAWAAVVGTAITHPTTITRWFEAKL